jgi:hypothetical protein
MRRLWLSPEELARAGLDASARVYTRRPDAGQEKQVVVPAEARTRMASVASGHAGRSVRREPGPSDENR